MQADKWLELNLVGLVTLGGLMFLTTKVMNLSTTVASVQANQAAASDRAENLAHAIQNQTTRVMSNDQVTRPLRTVVVVGRPERNGGKYYRPVSKIHTESAQRWIAEVPLASVKDR